MATKLRLAKKFLEEPEIYFCYQMDWRGRIYPIQTGLNPQADDTSKALLEFAYGKPLGEKGASWLKIHLANEMGEDPLTGAKLDKLPFKERIKWVEDHEDYIIDSALYPLDGSRFWSYAEHPFMFLAACEEYLGYHNEGEGFISYLSIAVDGSCNGLQHYSAILRDEVGGKATNLVPSEVPSDVYMEVTQKVNEKVKKEIQYGSEMAKAWEGKVDRSTVKRPAMTYVYGAKEYGMKNQLLAVIKKKDESLESSHTKYLEVDNFEACRWLGEYVYDSIGEVVVAAKNAMEWLQKVAKLVAKAELPMTWTTPDGFAEN
jgi:DNA-directed RNA polymerase